MTTYAEYALLVVGALALHHVAARVGVPAFLMWAGRVLFLLLLFAFMWKVSEPGSYLSDFHKAYYPAGQLVTSDPPDLYGSADAASGFVNIPLVALLFVPISWLGAGRADAMITVIGFLVVIASFVGLSAVARLQGVKRLALAALFLVNGPLYNTVREGNLTHEILLLLIAAVWCVGKRREGWLGVILAVATILKPPLALLALPFLVHRWRGTIAGFATTIAAACLASVAAFGVDLHRTWYRETVAPFARHPLGAFNVQSVDGFISRLLVGRNHLTDWSSITTLGPGFAVARYALVAFIVGVIAWVAWLTRRRRAETPDLLLELAIALCAALVIGPISWTHYYALLLLPIGLYLGGRLPVPATGPWVVAVCVAVALVSPPVIILHPGGGLLGQLEARVLISNYFYGAVLLLAVFLVARRRVGGALPVTVPAESRTRLESVAR